MVRRADRLTALGFIAFSVAMLAVLIFSGQGFGIHIKYIPPAVERGMIATFLIAALATNARALFLHTRYDHYGRKPWNDLSLIIINCGICIVSTLAMLTLLVVTI